MAGIGVGIFAAACAFCVLLLLIAVNDDSFSDKVFRILVTLAIALSLYVGYLVMSDINETVENAIIAEELVLEKEGLVRTIRVRRCDTWFEEFKRFRYKDITIEYSVRDSVVFIIKEN